MNPLHTDALAYLHALGQSIGFCAVADVDLDRRAETIARLKRLVEFERREFPIANPAHP